MGRYASDLGVTSQVRVVSRAEKTANRHSRVFWHELCNDFLCPLLGHLRSCGKGKAMVANKMTGNSIDLVRLDDEMAELALLLPGWQAQALSDAAQSEGISAATFLRRLIDRALPGANRYRFAE